MPDNAECPPPASDRPAKRVVFTGDTLMDAALTAPLLSPEDAATVRALLPAVALPAVAESAA